MNFKKLMAVSILMMAFIFVGCQNNDEPANGESAYNDNNDNRTDDAPSNPVLIDMALTPEEEELVHDLLEWDTPEEVILEMIEFHRLTVPQAHHLSEEEALEIVLQSIYETFGERIDVDDFSTFDNPGNVFFVIEFRSENWTNGERSFWLGNAIIYSDTQDLLYEISFRIDGVTGEVDILRDELQVELEFEPTVVEISWNGMALTVVNRSRAPSVWDDPSHEARIQPEHPSVEEIGELIAEAVYNEFGGDLNGHFLLIHLTHFADHSAWMAEVATEHDRCTTFAIVHVDAQTGAILLIDESEDPSNNPFSGC